MFRTDLRCSAKNALALPSTVIIVQRPTRTTCHPRPRQSRRTWLTNLLDATTCATFMSRPSHHTWSISGLRGKVISFPGEINGPHPLLNSARRGFSTSRLVLTRAIRARQNLYAILRDGLENSDQRGEFLFDGVGFLATVNEQRSEKVQDPYVSNMLMAPAASPGGQCHGWRRLAKN